MTGRRGEPVALVLDGDGVDIEASHMRRHDQRQRGRRRAPAASCGLVGTGCEARRGHRRPRRGHSPARVDPEDYRTARGTARPSSRWTAPGHAPPEVAEMPICARATGRVDVVRARHSVSARALTGEVGRLFCVSAWPVPSSGRARDREHRRRQVPRDHPDIEVPAGPSTGRQAQASRGTAASRPLVRVAVRVMS